MRRKGGVVRSRIKARGGRQAAVIQRLHLKRDSPCRRKPLRQTPLLRLLLPTQLFLRGVGLTEMKDGSRRLSVALESQRRGFLG